MQRPCDVCGTLYEAKRSTSKVCSSGCRVRKTRAGASTPAPVDLAPVRSGLAATVERELTDAGRLDTTRGQLALMLAGRIGSPMDTGASVASLSKELRAAMDAALEGATVAADPLDELKALRDRRRTG